MRWRLLPALALMPGRMPLHRRLEGLDQPARGADHGRTGDGDLGARRARPHWPRPSLRPRRADLAIRYTERLADAGAVGSVGSRGDSYDNALAESVNGLYKTEVIRKQGPWRSFEQLELATAKWVEWYNRRRLHSSIGGVPPAEFEEAYYRDVDAREVA
jgi:transposase InsO family protein